MVKKPTAITALTIATLALLVNFWAWSLLSPISDKLSAFLSTSSLGLAILLSTPVIIGSLGRVTLGVLADKFGGKMVFIFTSLFVAIVTGLIPFMNDYGSLIVVAALLGFGGATFSIGIPFISAWFPPAKRGLAIGIYSIGNAGTAVSGFLTPTLYNYLGFVVTALIVSVSLVIVALVIAFFVTESPSWTASQVSATAQIKSALRTRLTWDLSSIYVVSFGAYVAFGVYLPVILNTRHGLSLTDAAARAAGFILIATLARPVGGYLSDRFGAKKIIPPAILMIILLAVFIAFQNTLSVPTTTAYLSLAFVLGATNGAVFALIGRSAPQNLVGSIGGIVGAIGGLGGFLPPLILGLTYELSSTYMYAYLMLAATAIASLTYVTRRFRDKKSYPDASSWR